jgi:threonine dehydrogenase-like Zn-dependent dehydrogenase
MQAVAVVPSQRAVRLVEHPEPALASPTHVKARVLEVGVCGTDKEICCFDYGTPPAGSDHLVLGHECLAEVTEVGPGVTDLAPGDLVVPMVRRPCGRPECGPCALGRQDFCTTGGFTERGIKEAHGFMTEVIADEARYFCKVPHRLRDVGVLVEPLTIAQKALKQVWQIQHRLPWHCPHAPEHRPGVCHHAVVLGAGPVGLLGAMTFRTAGFTTYVYSREPEASPKGDLVRSIGCRYVSAENTPVDKLMDRVGSIDVVYEAAGASRLSFEVLAQIGPNAAFVFTGVPGRKAPVAVDTDLIMRNMVLRNQVVLGTVNAGRETFGDAIADLERFVEAWPDAVRSLITARVPVADFATLLGPGATPAGIKNVLTFAPSPAGGRSNGKKPAAAARSTRTGRAKAGA